MKTYCIMILIAAIACKPNSPTDATKENPPHASAMPEEQPQVTPFLEADAALNMIYRKKMAQIDEEDKRQLKADEIAWVHLKEVECRTAFEMDGSLTERDACLIEFTKSRTKYIQSVYPANMDGKIEGLYLESSGAEVSIKKAAQGYTFKAIAVGSNGHTGEISGEFLGDKKVFTWKNSNDLNCKKDSSWCCELTFEFRRKGVQVTELSCEGYHGTRARFDGYYRKGGPDA